MLLHYVGTTLKVSNKIKQGGKKSLIIHSRISTQIELLDWPCIDKREWSVLLTCESYESPQITYCVKKCCLTWIYQTRDCQMHVTKRPILDGYYDTSEGRFSFFFFFLLSCIFIDVLFLLNIGLKFRLIFSLFIYS